MKKDKIAFDRQYWIQQLILYGSLINPSKFTCEYKDRLIKAWQKEPLTELHQRVLRRKADADKLLKNDI